MLRGGNVLAWKGDFWEEVRDEPGYSLMANGGKHFSVQHRTGLFRQFSAYVGVQKGVK